MRPIGHIFNVAIDAGQRVITEPRDLAERHRREHNRIFHDIPQDQVRSAPYNSPGIIKVINQGEVYLMIVEKIQDAQARPILAAHSMVFSLDELSIKGLVLQPPTDIEAYRRMGTPSDLHGQGRRIEEIEAAIQECVSTVDLPVSAKSGDLNTREVNWLLDNPRTDVSDSLDQFLPEVTVRAFFEEIHPLVSAHLSFAVKFLPSIRFNITAHRGNVHPPLPMGTRSFRSEADFRAAIEGITLEEVFSKSDEENFRTHYEMVERITGSHVLDALRVYRDGLRVGRSGTSLTASFLAESIADPQIRERTLDACQSYRSVITNFPREDRETISRRIDDVSRNRRVSSAVRDKAATMAIELGAKPPTQGFTRRSGSPPRGREAHGAHNRQIDSRPEKERADASPKVRGTSRRAPQSSGRKHTDWLEIEDPQTVIRELARRTDAEVNIQDVFDSARRFTQLIIAGGTAVPKGGEYTDMVVAFWKALGSGVDRWLTEQESTDRSLRRLFKPGVKRKAGMKEIAEEFTRRGPRNSSSLLDDLMYVTDMATYGHIRTQVLRRLSAGYNDRREEIDRIYANLATEALEEATRLGGSERVRRSR